MSRGTVTLLPSASVRMIGHPDPRSSQPRVHHYPNSVPISFLSEGVSIPGPEESLAQAATPVSADAALHLTDGYTVVSCDEKSRKEPRYHGGWRHILACA